MKKGRTETFTGNSGSVALQHGAVRRGAVRRGAVRCGAVQFSAVLFKLVEGRYKSPYFRIFGSEGFVAYRE
jgi:hypothetical protein